MYEMYSSHVASKIGMPVHISNLYDKDVLPFLVIHINHNKTRLF